MKAFKTPPVCTVRWTAQDWARYEAMNGIEQEPETIKSTFGTWYKTDKKDEKGNVLYSLTK